MDPDSAHDLRRLGRQCGDCHKRDRCLVDFVAVIADKNALLVDKHSVTETRYTLKFPRLGCCPDQELRAYEGGVIHQAHAGILSFS
ncbi:hypothetical protein X971_4832 (plasmid) [Agrobacterium tumefaciens LBA4213 (Ach5)]|nr:hypothetical protein X971_4832 [Agrobacterium tumefaciens LBA4213 (Ach5)]